MPGSRADTQQGWEVLSEDRNFFH
ncbi:MAG: hypothetical protein QOG61_2162, partial [Candidatus Binataceae bacterium]|nr:hypothetical protein [Candidatus Binataceae bacterium]